MSRLWILALALTLVVTSLMRTPAQQEAERGVRLGTWNIQWLGNKERRRKQPESKDLAAYIRASKVDVLALNEISHTGEGDAPPTNTILTETFEILTKETGKPWKYLLFPKEPGKEKAPADELLRDQLCGIAWNDAVAKLVEKPFALPVRRGPSLDRDAFHRPVFAVKFSLGDKKTDLVLIPLHLKSNTFSKETKRGGVTQMSKVRAEEARAIVRVLGTVQNQFQDDDLVLLGDFNCLLREEPALSQFRATGLRDLNQADQLTWIRDNRYDPAPFDRILVPEEQPEFLRSSLTVFRESVFNSEREFRDRLSDHYLVFTDLRVMADDD